MSKRKRQRGSAARAAPGSGQLRLEADERRSAPAGAGSPASPVEAGVTDEVAYGAGSAPAEGDPAGDASVLAAADGKADLGAADAGDADPGHADGGDADEGQMGPGSADIAHATGAVASDVGPPSDPLGEFLTPLSSDLPVVSADAVGPPSGDFPTIASNAADAADAAEVPTPVRTRLRRFDTPIPRASTTPPIRPRPPPQVRQPPTPIELAPGTEITGDLLRQLREQRGITLKEIEEVTRVRATSLAAVEAERYVDLPDVKIYIRGFVQALARTIGVDAELAATSYLARWERTRDRTPGARRHFIK